MEKQTHRKQTPLNAFPILPLALPSQPADGSSAYFTLLFGSVFIMGLVTTRQLTTLKSTVERAVLAKELQRTPGHFSLSSAPSFASDSNLLYTSHPGGLLV